MVHVVVQTGPPSPPPPPNVCWRCRDHAWLIVVFLYASVGVVSWIAECVSWGNGAFTTVSNLAFATTGIAFWLLQHVDGVRINATVLGILPLTATLAAGSFVMHMHGPDRNPWSHRVDITTAWFVYVYLAVLPAYGLVKSRMPHRRVYHLAVLVYFAGSTLVLVYSDWIYDQQVILFVVLGAIMYAQLYALRVQTLRKSSSTTTTTTTITRALFDVGFLLATQGVSSALQGDANVVKGSQNAFRLNVEHGYWHMGCAVVMTMVPVYVVQALYAATSCTRPELFSQVAFGTFQLWLLVASYVPMDNVVYVGGTVGLQLLLFGATATCLWKKNDFHTFNPPLFLSCLRAK